MIFSIYSDNDDTREKSSPRAPGLSRGFGQKQYVYESELNFKDCWTIRHAGSTSS